MSLAIRGSLGSYRIFYSSVHASQRSMINERTCRRLFSDEVRSSPSQLPGPGEPGWRRFIANVEQHKTQPPISPAMLQQGKRLLELEQRVAQMEKSFLE